MITDLEQSIQEAIQYKDQPEALEVLAYIKKNNQTIDPKIIQQLSYIRLSSLSQLRTVDLFQQSVLAAYSIPDYVLSNEVVKYIQQIELVPDILQIAQQIKNILEKNSEILGTETITSLIKDYDMMPSNSRDAFSQTKFLNSSSKTKLLSKEGLQILNDILKVYDYCWRIVDFWKLLDEMPEEELAKHVNPNEDWRDLLPPELDDSTAGKIIDNIDKTRSQRPAIPRPIPTMTDINPVGIAPIVPVQTPPPPASLTDNKAQSLPEGMFVDEITGEVSKPTVNPKPPIKVKLATEQTGGAKIHDLINSGKRGIVRDPTNIQLDEEKQRVQKIRDRQAGAIQDKLAALRNKKKT